MLGPPSRDLSNPGIEPTSLKSPALAGGLFTTSTTWEAQCLMLFDSINFSLHRAGTIVRGKERFESFFFLMMGCKGMWNFMILYSVFEFRLPVTCLFFVLSTGKQERRGREDLLLLFQRWGCAGY